jgi:hypothetical protein
MKTPAITRARATTTAKVVALMSDRTEPLSTVEVADEVACSTDTARGVLHTLKREGWLEQLEPRPRTSASLWLWTGGEYVPPPAPRCAAPPAPEPVRLTGEEIDEMWARGWAATAGQISGRRGAG